MKENIEFNIENAAKAMQGELGCEARLKIRDQTFLTSARIICTDTRSYATPIVALVTDPYDGVTEIMRHFMPTGKLLPGEYKDEETELLLYKLSEERLTDNKTYRYFVSATLYNPDADKRSFAEDIVELRKPIENLQDILDVKDILRRDHFLPKHEINILGFTRIY